MLRFESDDEVDDDFDDEDDVDEQDDRDGDDDEEDEDDVETWQVHASAAILLNLGSCLTSRVELLDWREFAQLS
jgi:hypothetical protein